MVPVKLGYGQTGKELNGWRMRKMKTKKMNDSIAVYLFVNESN